MRYELKTPWRDGTMHVFFEPLDSIAWLVALVPKPRLYIVEIAVLSEVFVQMKNREKCLLEK